VGVRHRLRRRHLRLEERQHEVKIGAGRKNLSSRPKKKKEFRVTLNCCRCRNIRT
jgi:hypothetical protein